MERNGNAKQLATLGCGAPFVFQSGRSRVMASSISSS